jgi:D-tyrosyl-tRNA(Tyr) deacylase
MIGLLQRVSKASVTVNNEIIGSIDRGLLVFFAVHRDDDENKIARMVNKILSYRVFPDSNNRMNLNIRDISGELLIIPQFTLAADTDKGTRANLTKAAPPEKALEFFKKFIDQCKQSHSAVACGKFAADMKVSLINDGPVTFWLEI